MMERPVNEATTGTDDQASRRQLAFWIPVGLMAAILFFGVLTGAFFLGQSTRKSGSEVTQLLQAQAAKDQRVYASERVAAVQKARETVRTTWQVRMRKERRNAAAQAAEKGRQEGYASGNAAGFSSGKNEGFDQGFDEGTCYTPTTLEYIC